MPDGIAIAKRPNQTQHMGCDDCAGNGLSDKPSLFRRSRWWTIDDYVERDVPALIRYVLRVTHARQVHFLGHSMGEWGV